VGDRSAERPPLPFAVDMDPLSSRGRGKLHHVVESDGHPLRRVQTSPVCSDIRRWSAWSARHLSSTHARGSSMRASASTTVTSR